MLSEINELAGELKRPVESASRMVQVDWSGEFEKAFAATIVNLAPFRVAREEVAEREHVSHLGVVHFHVWPKLARRRFRIVCSETVDHVIRFRTVGDDTLAIEKVAPLHDDFCDT